jgi:hypothetical protein
MHEKIGDLPTAVGNIYRNRAAINEPLIEVNRTGIGRLAH